MTERIDGKLHANYDSLTLTGNVPASAAALQIGNSTTARTLAASAHAIDIYTTSADITATITPFHLKSITTGYQSEDRTMSVHSYTDVYSGNENTVGHFYSEWGGTGTGPLGLASAVTAKMLLPTTCTGAFFPFYGKINFPADPYAGIVDPSAPGNSCGWFLLSIGGDSGGYANFDDYGLFMEIHNISAGSGNLLSLSSHTLRCAIPAAGTIKYLIVSQMEDGLGLGTSGTKMVLGDGLHAIDIHCSTALTGGTEMSIPVEINLTRLDDGGSGICRDWGLKVNMISDSNKKFASAANAIYGAFELGTGGVHGRAAALQGEMVFPGGQVTRGTFSCCTLEITEVSGTNTGSSGPTSFLSMVIAGASNNFDTRGYIFEITGLSTTDGGPFFVNAKGACDAMLKILIGGVDYFIPLATDDDSNWNAT